MFSLMIFLWPVTLPLLIGYLVMLYSLYRSKHYLFAAALAVAPVAVLTVYQVRWL